MDVSRAKLHKSARKAGNEPIARQGPVMLYPLAIRAAKPLIDWTPFVSSLIDTVAVLIKVRHKSLKSITKDNPNVKMKGNFVMRVTSKFSRSINARMLSRDYGETLYIEASIPKFLTGQNIVGREDMFEPCVELIFEVLARAGIKMTIAEASAIRAGLFKMVRVDFAAHCDCGTPERASAVMAAARSLVMAKAKDASAYGEETIYVNQHSSCWTLRVYRKDVEVNKPTRRLSASVYGKDYLTHMVQNCVRIEHVLRRPELKRLGLDDPLAWNTGEARQRLQVWINRFSRLNGRVPNLNNIEELTKANQIKLRAWLLGDLTAFKLAPSSFSASRRAILAATGIDIRGEPSIELQRRAMLCIRDVFSKGIGFKCHEAKWAALRAGSGAA